jgi:16S rRNA (cytosine967-C5)-methyltransferase
LPQPPPWLQPTDWPGFYVVPAGRWREVEPLVAAGVLYLQDPAARTAAGLLDPLPGETVLDLCAAPGGKSLLLADLLVAGARRGDGAKADPAAAGSVTADVPGSAAGTTCGRVVAVDLPDERRLGRLRANLANAGAVDVALVEADVLRLCPGLLAERGLPSSYTAVLLDTPCSNTGVMRHRVDVKWRLQESDIATHARQQLALLAAAARLVAGPAAGRGGGRLVYSTCSLESEENEGVVEAFLRASGAQFALEEARHGRPWEDGCDGASAFLLRRLRDEGAT